MKISISDDPDLYTRMGRFLRADIFFDKSRIVCKKNVMTSCRASPDLTQKCKISKKLL